MHDLVPFVQAALYVVMGLSLVAALGVVLFPNLFHAALCLVGTLLGIAGIYIALKAEFIAIVQILIYVGAVMTLVIFAIMMTERIAEITSAQSHRLRLITFGAAVVFATLLIKMLHRTPWTLNPANAETQVTVADLGHAMLGRYVFPFEVISVVLIVALIGAIVIAKKEDPS